MHSSRMRTGRSLTVCCSLLPGGVCLVGGGCLPGPGGSPCLVGGGGSPCQVPGGCLPGGGWGWGLPAWSGGGSPCQVGGVVLSAWSGGVLPDWRSPPVNRITHTCTNITLATTSLRPVKVSEQNHPAGSSRDSTLYTRIGHSCKYSVSDNGCQWVI